MHVHGRLFSVKRGALVIRDAGVTRVAEIEGLAEHPGLTFLVLSGNALESLEGLPVLPALENLIVDQNHLETLAGLPRLPRLRTLNVAHNALHTLAGLPALPALDFLVAAHNQLDSLAGLPPLPRLERLELDHNQLANLAGIEALRALKVLYLDHNRLESLTGLEYLVHLDKLQLLPNPFKRDPKLRFLVGNKPPELVKYLQERARETAGDPTVLDLPALAPGSCGEEYGTSDACLACDVGECRYVEPLENRSVAAAQSLQAPAAVPQSPRGSSPRSAPGPEVDVTRVNTTRTDSILRRVRSAVPALQHLLKEYAYQQARAARARLVTIAPAGVFDALENAFRAHFPRFVRLVELEADLASLTRPEQDALFGALLVESTPLRDALRDALQETPSTPGADLRILERLYSRASLFRTANEDLASLPPALRALHERLEHAFASFARD